MKLLSSGGLKVVYQLTESLPVKYTEDYYNAITAPGKEMQLIEGWGHTVPQENPKEFTDTLKKMLEDMVEQ